VTTFFLWFAEVITWKSCVQNEITHNSTISTFSFDHNKCTSSEAVAECISNGGTCRIDIDGYYIEVTLNVVYGILWYRFAKNFVENLETVPINDWHVLSKERTEQNPEATPLADKHDKV
jgi:MFS transporter, PAT family, solute carrier family 33 (acetyl-CoA transportor), member 1